MKIHIVQPGDTLWLLAQKYNTPIERLREANPELGEIEELNPGMKIRVPTGRIPITSSNAAKAKEPAKEQSSEKNSPSPQPEFAENHTAELPKPPRVPNMPSQHYGWESVSAWESSIFEDEGGLQGFPELPPYPYPVHAHGFWPYYSYESMMSHLSSFPYFLGTAYGHVFQPYPFADPVAHAQPWPSPGAVPEPVVQGSQAITKWAVKESSSSEG